MFVDVCVCPHSKSIHSRYLCVERAPVDQKSKTAPISEIIKRRSKKGGEKTVAPNSLALED